MKPLTTTENAGIDGPFLITEDSTPFSVLFQQPVLSSVTDEGTTRTTDVVQETTDDD